MNTYYKLQNNNIAQVGFDPYYYEGSPREWDNLGTFLTWLNGYCSPDDNNYSDFEEFINSFDVYPADWNWTEEDVLPELIKNADGKGYFLFPVYVYEHSLITYSIKPTIPYGGIGGVIFVEKEKIFKETSLTPTTENLVEKVKKMLGGEVEVYDYWANGYVMDYMEYDILNDDVVESCTGFLGLDEKESGIYDEYNLKNAELIGDFDNLPECIQYLKDNGKISMVVSWNC